MVEIEMIIKPTVLDTLLGRASSWLHTRPELSSAQFQQLLWPHKDHLYNFIVKSLYYSEDAQDVYQETVLRAFKYRSSFNQARRDSFKTWLFAIAANQIKRYFKDHHEEQARAQQTPLEQLPLEAQGHSYAQQLMETVYEIAQELKDHQRRVFFLFYDEHFSIKEIVHITGLKEGNIKFILNQTREKIKARLRQHEHRKDS